MVPLIGRVCIRHKGHLWLGWWSSCRFCSKFSLSPDHVGVLDAGLRRHADRPRLGGRDQVLAEVLLVILLTVLKRVFVGVWGASLVLRPHCQSHTLRPGNKWPILVIARRLPRH